MIKEIALTRELSRTCTNLTTEILVSILHLLDQGYGRLVRHYRSSPCETFFPFLGGRSAFTREMCDKELMQPTVVPLKPLFEVIEKKWKNTWPQSPVLPFEWEDLQTCIDQADKKERFA